MMYHCIAIAVGFPSDTKDFEDVSHPSLHQPVDDRQKHAEEEHGGNDHRRGRNHVVLARPGYLLHFHANVVQEFARVRDRSGNSLADAAAAPVMALLPDSSFFTFTDCVAMKTSSL